MVAVRTVIERAPSGRVAKEGVEFPQRRARELARALEREIAGEVRFDDGARALYSTDASNYRQVPIGVVTPKTVEDVVRTVELCRAFDAPITPRGGGTGLAGQTCNTAVVIDFSKHLNRVVKLDPDARLAEVEPGCVLDTLRDAAERFHLTFGPDPATHDHNTLGGMIGNDSCGEHSLMAGRTADNVQSLEILTYDGCRMTVGPTSEAEFQRIQAEGGRRAEIYRALRDFWAEHGRHFERVYPDIPRRVSGYENLDQLSPKKGFNVARALVGTEATLVTVLKATLNLVPSPPARVVVVIGFDDIFQAADAVPDLLQFGPIAMEGLDGPLIDAMRREHLHTDDLRLLPKGRGWLILEFGGADKGEAAARAEACVRKYGGRAKLMRNKPRQQQLWRVREAALPAAAHAPGQPDTYPGWEDSAVRRDDLGDYLRGLKALLKKYGYEGAIYGHFGDGLVHCRISFDLRSEGGLKAWQGFLNEAADLVVRYGGSLSGEHGDGQARAALLEKMYGPELMAAQRAFKAIWDPWNRMNPGKVIDPYPITSNLRIGPLHQPPKVKGLFAYPEDDDDFTRATERCVGVGECRRWTSENGVMCPSYMATGEEAYSTRGRARLLYEMLRGQTIADGWRSRAVEDALDLCLGCKGCKRDCPMHVDMAAYKGEFRAHHYRGRLRPRAAYAMGQIRAWAEAASRASGLANLVFRTPGLSALAKAIGGVHPKRAFPPFARQTFRAWFEAQPSAGGGERVVLWPDTFNDYFRPQTAIAATRLLQQLGFSVAIPPRPLCCGRPLYDWGWLEQAKRLWRRTLDTLRADIEAGTPVVGLEPACVSAFKDELKRLFPGDPLAERLSRQTLFLTEFLQQRCIERLPKLGGEALVQMHCHEHASLDPQAEAQVLGKCGVRANVLPSGCCGMAGAFGFEAAKYDVSMRLAERVLLPAVRAAPEDTAILANGFSCREQIEQGSGRKTLHIAELLAGCL